ncbi:hypothetical protein PF008_g13786 [Phytophthora fragariae]|uniref:Uncharacterized protein n=1 Tax=Phytophthora fragariae TaxID=53985 RepID=A0A6G0RIV7_9STRA|nr:hypothetical protein PF008_g13786 [Phytophthora fragariae]
MKTCRGIARSTGVRCKRTFPLNELGYCGDHAKQASSSNENRWLAEKRAQRVTSTCRGFHGDGKPCDLETDLGFYGFCVRHRLQGPPQCIAIVRHEDRRCHQTVGVNAQGFCVSHGPGDLRTPRCQGRFFKTRMPCTNNAKRNYNFCCSAHDPSLVYRKPWIQFGFISATVSWTKSSSFTTDDVLRESVVNEEENLALTRADTNRIKGAAVWKFLDDSRTGHRDGKTFTAYLIEASCDGKTIKRDVTRRITRAMGSALKKSWQKLHNEGETPVLETLAINLQQLYVDMELRQRRSS